MIVGTEYGSEWSTRDTWIILLCTVLITYQESYSLQIQYMKYAMQQELEVVEIFLIFKMCKMSLSFLKSTLLIKCYIIVRNRSESNKRQQIKELEGLRCIYTYIFPCLGDKQL